MVQWFMRKLIKNCHKSIISVDLSVKIPHNLRTNTFKDIAIFPAYTLHVTGAYEQYTQ